MVVYHFWLVWGSEWYWCTPFFVHINDNGCFDQCLVDLFGCLSAVYVLCEQSWRYPNAIHELRMSWWMYRWSCFAKSGREGSFLFHNWTEIILICKNFGLSLKFWPKRNSSIFPYFSVHLMHNYSMYFYPFVRKAVMRIKLKSLRYIDTCRVCF